MIFGGCVVVIGCVMYFRRCGRDATFVDSQPSSGPFVWLRGSYRVPYFELVFFEHESLGDW